MADDELELGHEGSSGGETIGVRKNIALKLKPSPKARRGRKPKQKKEEPKEDVKTTTEEPGETEIELPILKGPLAPQHKNRQLNWDHKVNLIGERVVDPLIHSCETCNLPILIYGRMIPCKHVFCFDCAKKADKLCTRCNDPVQRIEQAALGTVFVCTNGGAKHGVSGCRRTYLSNRDLQAHVHYRHRKDQAQTAAQQASQAAPLQQVQSSAANAMSLQQTMTQQSTAAVSMIGQRTDYPASASNASGPNIAGLTLQGSQMYRNDAIHQLPPNFASAHPPVVGQGTLQPQPVIQSQGFHQPPPATIENYNNMGPGLVAGQMDPNRPGALISIPLQNENRGAFHPGLQHPGYMPAQGTAPPNGPFHPPVSFAGNMGAPPQVMHGVPMPMQTTAPMPGHIQRHGGPSVSSHGGIMPRFPPGQSAPFSQSGPPMVGGPRTWPGPGSCGPPVRGPPPRGPTGAPSRYN